MTTVCVKSLVMIMSSAVCLFGSSCFTIKPLHYAVDIINDGKEKIIVDSFEIVQGPHATVAVGEVNPGGTAGMSPFYYKPLQKVVISWRAIKTGEKSKAEVAMELPKEFTKKNGSAIVFHINPEDGVVDVTYEILDPRTGRLKIIRQE